MLHTLSVLVENQAGVLAKVSGLFARRGFNIHSLAVGVTDDPHISRMTIVLEGNEHQAEQMEKQLNKVISVIKVKQLTAKNTIARTTSLFKVSVGQSTRPDVMRIAELMRARIVDVTRATLTLEFTDSVERTATLEALLRPYGIKEVVRTGIIAIEKGANPIRVEKSKGK